MRTMSQPAFCRARIWPTVASASSVGEYSRNAVAMLTVTIVGFVNLIFLCRPFTKWRMAVVGIVAAGLALTFPVTTFLLGDMLKLKPAFDNMLYLFGTLGVGIAVCSLFQIFKKNIEAFAYGIVGKFKKNKQ